MDKQISLIILCGGLGTRIRSIATDKPKALITIQDKTILEHILYRYEAHVSEIILATGFKADQIVDKIRNKFLRTPVFHSKENEPLGTGGALKLALDHVKTPKCLIINGDTYVTFNTSFLSAKNNFIVTHKSNPPHRYNAFALVEDNITKFLPVGKGNIINAGVYCFMTDQLRNIVKNHKIRCSLENDILPDIFKTLDVKAVESDGFIDIGVPEDYLKAQSMVIFNA